MADLTTAERLRTCAALAESTGGHIKIAPAVARELLAADTAARRRLEALEVMIADLREQERAMQRTLDLARWVYVLSASVWLALAWPHVIALIAGWWHG